MTTQGMMNIICSLIAECRLAYAKLMPMSAVRVCSLIAECRLAYAKIGKKHKSAKEWGNTFSRLILIIIRNAWRGGKASFKSSEFVDIFYLWQPLIGSSAN